MSEVKRYGRIGDMVLATKGLLELYPAMTVYVRASDYDAAQAELAALREELAAQKETVALFESEYSKQSASLTASEQRNAVMAKALERITRPHDCGCVPCLGSCQSKTALEITLEEIREIAGAALKPTESGASE